MMASVNVLKPSASPLRPPRLCVSIRHLLKDCIANNQTLRSNISVPSSPKVGDEAPDFELPSTDGPMKLSSLRGQPVVLVFYPGDFTPVCTKQLCSYRDAYADLVDTGAKVLAISADSMESHERFKKE